MLGASANDALEGMRVGVNQTGQQCTICQSDFIFALAGRTQTRDLASPINIDGYVVPESSTGKDQIGQPGLWRVIHLGGSFVVPEVGLEPT